MGRRTSLALVALLAVLLALSGCSSGGSDDAGGEQAVAPAEREVPADGTGLSDRDAAFDGADDVAAPTTRRHSSSATQVGAVERKLIQKGNVSLASDDVARTAAAVQRIADEHLGEVTERKTTTDGDGEVSTARLVLRVPAADFSDAFTQLEKVADLLSSSATAEDVTTQVIDTKVRIRAQRRSLRRVEVLLDRAETIRDIVSIEAQLTRRQADLESLEQQLAFLTDQTSMSTITVNVERKPEERPDEPEEQDDDGFLAGLSAGWDALGTFATGLATVAGAVLPFAVVIAVLGLPVLLLLRRNRRRPAPADA